MTQPTFSPHDQQDALGAGLAVTEYALGGKSAEEIRSLWQWVWNELTVTASAFEQPLPANQEIGLQAAV